MKKKEVMREGEREREGGEDRPTGRQTDRQRYRLVSQAKTRKNGQKKNSCKY